jgi:hypothetical protein
METSYQQSLEKRVFPFQRDFLGKCEKYLDSHTIEGSSNWRREGIAFDVEIEFFYSIPGETEKKRYYAKYYYHRDTKRMVKRDYV